jgi:hypothetical protein
MAKTITVAVEEKGETPHLHGKFVKKNYQDSMLS